MDNRTFEPWEQNEKNLAEETRNQLIDLGIELVTFSDSWFIDRNCEGYFKAWHRNGLTKEFDRGMWGRIHNAVHWNATSKLGAEYARSSFYVFGWQVINSRVQIAAQNRRFVGGFDYHEDDVAPHTAEWIAYQEAKQEWGGNADPNYRYDLTGDLQQMFAAMRWSPNDQDSISQLEHFLHHPDEFVRSSLAVNPNIAEDILIELGYDPSIHVRNTIRMNPGTPGWLKKVLGRDFERFA
jgi:hypothetical protein